MKLERVVKEIAKHYEYRDESVYGLVYVATKSFGIVAKGDTLVVDGETNSLRGCDKDGAVKRHLSTNPIIPLYGLSDYGNIPIDDYIKNNVFTLLQN